MMTAQTQIKIWFDQVYQQRGFNYLRPMEAYEIFATILNTRAGDKHLDVACGLGLLLKVMKNKGAEVHGIDLSSEAIKGSRQFCSEAFLTEANAERIPYQDETFDSITCIGSLERIINREKALKEHIRVAKSHAKFVFMVRNSEHFTWKYLMKPFGLENKKGHQDAMNLDEWKNLFESTGFRIMDIYPDHWPYYRLLKTLKPWARIDTGKVRRFPFPLHLAYEFIFLLEKA